METRTIKSVLYEKVIDSLVRASWGDIFRTLSKVSLAIVLSLGAIFYHATLEIAKFAWFYGDFALGKIIGSFLLVFFWRVWVRVGEWAIGHIRDSIAEYYRIQEKAVTYIRGIPIPELVDYLFETNGLKITDTMNRFAISRSTYDFIATGMEETFILIRGENNARVLNKDFSRTDVVSILYKADTEGFRRLTRKDEEESYTHLPSMPKILERNSTPPSTGFTRRPINTVSVL